LNTVVHFSPDLSAWLLEELDRGRSPAALVRTMTEQRMEPVVARAIVDAFLTAKIGKRAVPVDSVILETDDLDYVREAPILKAGSRIETFDRVVRVITRAEKPALAVLANVFSGEECEELIALARPHLRPSTVVDPRTGKDVIAEHRNSFGMFFRLRENAFLARLDRRVSEIMNLDLENGEGFQVLHYPTGAASSPHFDFLQASNAANQASIARSGQRVASLVVYLNDVESGGETVFPKAGWAVSPQRGNAVHFEYCNRLGQVDPDSLHGGNPVLQGEKWVATKWMRERRFVSAGEAGSEGMMGS